MSTKTSQKYPGVRSQELNNGDIAYYVRFTDIKGKRIERKVGTKSSGWSAKKAHLKRIELQNEPIANLANITISDIIERYLQVLELHLKHQTFIDYKGQCLKHILPFFGTYKPHEIVPRHINDFMLHLREKSPKTINKLLERARAIMDFAIAEYALDLQNPFKHIKKLKINNARERFLSKEEVALLLQEAKKEPNIEIYYFFVLAFSTGARLNSVRAITMSDIDLSAGTIKMQDFKNSSKYTAFLTPLAKQTFQHYKQNIIFKTPERTIARAMQSLLNRLFNQNIAPNDRKQKVVIHTTRHTFASHLAMAGTPLQLIQKLLNHKDIKMTMRYAHLLPESGREWVARLWE